MIKNRFELMSHFKICFDIFLHRSGDITNTFLERVIDFKTLTLHSNEPKFLNDTLKTEIRRSLKNNSERFIDHESSIGCFNFSYFKNFELRFSICNIEYAFILNYGVPAPLSFFFNKKSNLLFDEIFKKLLKWKIFHNLNSKIFAVLKDHNSKKIKDGLLMKIWIVLQRAFNIINSILNYIFNEVKIWPNFIYNLNSNY